MAQRKTLLVVDDNEELRGAIAEQLQLSEDFSAIEAATAGDGVRAAIENRPDLILLDVMMPDMDGFEVCRRLKSNPATHFIPVVMVTALDSPADRPHPERRHSVALTLFRRIDHAVLAERAAGVPKAQLEAAI